MNFEFASEFDSDLKKLQKKWRSLPQDISAVKLQITDLYSNDIGASEYRKAFFNGKRATILAQNETYEVVKMRLDVESIGRSDKARIIFIAIKFLDKIIFIELYAKNTKSREDKRRINKYTH